MSWLKWMHKLMGTEPEAPREYTVPEDREAIIKTKMELRRERRDVEDLDALVTMAEKQLAARGRRKHP